MDYWSDSNRYRAETHRYVRLTEIRYGSGAENEQRERELTGIGHGDFANFIGEGERWRRSLNVFFFFSDFSYFILILNLLKKKKNKTNGNTNWVITEPWINKNWKLENWIDKTES